MSEDLRCFKCHRETRWYGWPGQTGVGVHIYPPVTTDDSYSYNTLSVCLDCLRKTSIPDVIQEAYRTRTWIKPYGFSDGTVYCCSPCPTERKCLRCHGNITLFYQDVTINFCDGNQGNNVDYCSRCYPKICMDKAYQEHIRSISGAYRSF